MHFDNNVSHFPEAVKLLAVSRAAPPQQQFTIVLLELIYVRKTSGCNREQKRNFLMSSAMVARAGIEADRDGPATCRPHGGGEGPDLSLLRWEAKAGKSYSFLNVLLSVVK